MAFRFRIKRGGNKIFSSECPVSRAYCWLVQRGRVDDRRSQCSNFLHGTSQHKDLCTLDKSTPYFDGATANG